MGRLFYVMNNYEDKAVYLQPSAVQVGLRNLCPRCGQGKLFTGLLQPAKSCMNCKLDYSFIDSGDGPAVFVILILGFIVTAMAMALQNAIQPPIWVHILIWTPVITILALWALRFTKGVMIALQFQTKAREGALSDQGSS